MQRIVSANHAARAGSSLPAGVVRRVGYGAFTRAMDRAPVVGPWRCARQAAETLARLGLPSVLHGNIIEVSRGMVGIDDACSGIRSFQATLMIALFFGELYSLRLARRMLCVIAVFALA